VMEGAFGFGSHE